MALAELLRRASTRMRHEEYLRMCISHTAMAERYDLGKYGDFCRVMLSSNIETVGASHSP